MFDIILLLIITAAFALFCREVFNQRLKRKKEECARLFNELSRANESKRNLGAENNLLNKNFEDTLALYELTKDICKSLDEEKDIFDFQEKFEQAHQYR